MRPILVTLVGWLSVSSCAAPSEPKCAERTFDTPERVLGFHPRRATRKRPYRPRAIGVTEKRAFGATVALDQRTIEVTALVGRVARDWRVLFVTAGP